MISNVWIVAASRMRTQGSSAVVGGGAVPSGWLQTAIRPSTCSSESEVRR